MVENAENFGSGLESKFMQILLVIAVAFLLFAGPTYVPYVLSDILNVGATASMVAGFALFILGLLLMVFLVRKKIIT